MKYQILIFFLLVGSILNAQEELIEELKPSPSPAEIQAAQEAEKIDTMPSIVILTQVKRDKIRFRWGPRKIPTWLQGMQHGYKLERYGSINSNGTTKSGWIPLSDGPIKPLPLEEWETIVKEDNYAAIAAQCIYGTDKKDPEVDGVWDAADDLSNRFGFALLAADQSLVAADASGFYFEIPNSTPDSNHISLFRIYLAGSSDTLAVIDTAYTFIISNQLSVNKIPRIEEIKSGDLALNLHFDKRRNKEFSGIFIERSEDGRTFEPLNDAPILLTSTNINGEMSDFVFTDSVAVNYKDYYYRVSGINAFGERDGYSEVLKAQAVDLTPPPAASNLVAEEIEDKKVKVTWEWEGDPNQSDFAGFEVIRSNSVKEGYSPLHEGLLPKGSFTYIDETPKETLLNYYIIAAVDTAGNKSYSTLEGVKVIDREPPAAPMGLQGKIDSQGVVFLYWEKGPEEDIMGYQVYFANSPDHVFTQVTRARITENYYVDTVKVNTLTENVYYRFVAIDMNFNYSEFSEILELKRPDFIPPVPAIIGKYEVSMEGVQFDWIPSTSTDVLYHRIYRRLDNSPWELIKTYEGDEETRFTDLDVKQGVHYSYLLEVEDDAGHIVHCPKNLRILARGDRFNQGVSTINISSAKNALELVWESPDENAKTVIYRATGDGPLITYKHLQAGKYAFKDYKVEKDITYSYSLQVIYPDGKSSKLSDEKTAKLNP